MPRTFGRNQIHVSQVVGWTEADYPLVEVAPAAVGEADLRIAALIAERIPNGATLQVGIGGIPNAILSTLVEPSRPRDPHRTDLRRRHGSRRHEASSQALPSS